MNNMNAAKILDEKIINSPIRKIKRIVDVALAAMLLVITFPFFPLVVVAIKLTSPGPVFFKQMRIGLCMPLQTHLFMMIKFRTMMVDAEKESGAVWAAKNDSRVTPIGAFLRKTRLDELPQLINVLKGDMSLIGPRPERPGFYQRLENEIPYFSERTYGILPGITGLAQVNQGYDTCIDDVRSKLGFDLSYALSIQTPVSWLRTDISIMWKTVVVMFAGRGQ